MLNDMQKRPDLQKLVYTIEEAAQVLSVSTKTIRRFLGRRILTAVPGLGKKLIPRKQVEAYVCNAPAPSCPLINN